MALSESDYSLLEQAFDNLPSDVRALFNTNATGDMTAAIAAMITERRKVSITAAVTALIEESGITAGIGDWASLEEALAVVDSNTMMDNLRDFKAAIASQDASALYSSGITACLAAVRYFNL